MKLTGHRVLTVATVAHSWYRCPALLPASPHSSLELRSGVHRGLGYKVERAAGTSTVSDSVVLSVVLFGEMLESMSSEQHLQALWTLLKRHLLSKSTRS